MVAPAQTSPPVWTSEVEEKRLWQRGGAGSMLSVLGFLVVMVGQTMPTRFADFSPVYAALLVASVGVWYSKYRLLDAFFMYMPTFVMIASADYWLVTESWGEHTLPALALFQVAAPTVFILRAVYFKLPHLRIYSFLLLVNSAVIVINQFDKHSFQGLASAERATLVYNGPRWLLFLPVCAFVLYLLAYLFQERSKCWSPARSLAGGNAPVAPVGGEDPWVQAADEACAAEVAVEELSPAAGAVMSFHTLVPSAQHGPAAAAPPVAVAKAEAGTRVAAPVPAPAEAWG